jgi:hypothetical protein
LRFDHCQNQDQRPADKCRLPITVRAAWISLAGDLSPIFVSSLVPSRTNAHKFKVGGVHYILYRIDAAEPHDNPVAAELLEVRGTRELQIRQPRAD